MPALITSAISSEDDFEEMMVVENSAEEAAAIIQGYIEDNQGAEIEIAAGQYVHIGDSVDGDNFEIQEIDRATADFMISVMGGDYFGTGIMASHIFAE